MNTKTDKQFDTKSWDVVIAGAGPTGLTLAGELALAGIRALLVERRSSQELVGHRARGLHSRTIEVFDQRGIAERFLAAGQAMQTTGFSFIPLDISDFPTRHNYGLAIEQRQVEQLLAQWIDELGVPIARGVEVTGLEQGEAGVTVELSDGRVLGARYLVGCDGGRSLVRKLAGIEFAGWDASVSYLIAEVEVTDEPPWGFRRGDRGVNALGKMADGKASIVLVEPQVELGAEPTLEELRAALVAVYGSHFGAHNPSWLSRFSDMARQATRYRQGRILLAGDAAHVHAPSGGQGLNLGVQDAVNLGWKLAQVVRGQSPESLLDSYHAERHPIAARVLRLTMAQTALGRGDLQTEALREIVSDLLSLGEPRRRYGAILSGLEVHYALGEGHPLLGRRVPDLEVSTESAAVRLFSFLHSARPLLLQLGGPSLKLGGWSDRVQLIRGEYGGSWELPGIGAVAPPCALLVRPDGHVAWVGEGSCEGLAEALAMWFGPGELG